MQSMDQALVLLARQNLVTAADAEQKALDRDNFKHLMLGKLPPAAGGR